MKLYQLLTVFVILQVSSINARTLEDVLKDFQPVFDQIHNEIGTLQGTAHNIGTKQIAETRAFLLQKSRQVTQNLTQASSEIGGQMRGIVAENGMQAHVDLIQHCYTAEQNDYLKMVENANIRSGVCEAVGNKKISDLEKILAGLYDEQSKLHATVEQTKKTCMEKNQTPDDLQECLIINLYFVHKAQVKDLANKTGTVLNKTAEFTANSIEDIDSCFSFIYSRIQSDKLSVINNFRNCVVDAAENLP